MVLFLLVRGMDWHTPGMYCHKIEYLDWDASCMFTKFEFISSRSNLLIYWLLQFEPHFPPTLSLPKVSDWA